MHLNWKNRLEQQPSLRKFSAWPLLIIDTLPTVRRKPYLRNRHLVAQVLQGERIKVVAKTYGVTPGRVTQLMNRCLGGEDDEQPALNKGLVPHATIREKKRRSPLPRLGDKLCRGPCTFKALLVQVPGLKEALDNLLIAKIKDKPYAQLPTPQSSHGEFKRVLAGANWPTDLYPYTSDSLAYESLRKYMAKRHDELLLARKKPRSQQHSIRRLTPRRALRAIQIDEHMLDLRTKIELVLNEELIQLPVSKASVLVATDVDTHVILGYQIAYSDHPNQQDMLLLIENCLLPWTPMKLTTPELSYTPGACCPSGLTEGHPISFGMIQLDNALIHYAQSVVNLLCKHLGATLNYGHPRTPTTRDEIERRFNYVCDKVTHRFASTSGSHPHDPIKESRKNQKQAPTISMRVLEEAVSVALTEYNITPQAALGHASPLELFKSHCQSHYVRYIPRTLSEQWHCHLSESVVRLHWYKYESRDPFINYAYARYNGDGLITAARNHETHIRIRYDRRDIRKIQALSLDGTSLGELHAPATWMRYPHSLATRQRIYQLNRRYRFGMRDILAGYFHYLLANKETPSIAIELLRAYSEFTHESSDAPIYIGKESPVSLPPPLLQSHKYQWYSDNAKQTR